MSPEQLQQAVHGVLRERLGVTFVPNHDRWLFSQLKVTAGRYGFDNVGLFVAQVLRQPSNNSVWQDVIHAITVHETDWMRYKAPISFALEGLGHGVENLRFLSVGCSYGQEVYSTFLLARAMHEHAEITGYGLDISKRCLEVARNGRYQHDYTSGAISGYLQSGDLMEDTDEGFSFSEEIKGRMTFTEANVVQHSSVPSRPHFDLILAFNCLTYYPIEVREHVANNLARALPLGGILILSGAELQGFTPADTVMLDKSWPQIFVKGS